MSAVSIPQMHFDKRSSCEQSFYINVRSAEPCCGTIVNVTFACGIERCKSGDDLAANMKFLCKNFLEII
jgi:hypothetical protein